MLPQNELQEPFNTFWQYVRLTSFLLYSPLLFPLYFATSLYVTDIIIIMIPLVGCERRASLLLCCRENLVTEARRKDQTFSALRDMGQSLFICQAERSSDWISPKTVFILVIKRCLNIISSVLRCELYHRVIIQSLKHDNVGIFPLFWQVS